MDSDALNTPVPTAPPDRDAGRRRRAGYRRLWLYSVCVTTFVSLTPLVILTSVNFYYYRKALREEMMEPIFRLVSISRRFMDDFLEERRAALTYVARSESYEDLCDHEKLGRVLLDTKESFGGFIDLGVIDSDGNQRSYAGPYALEGKNYREQSWFQEVCIRGIHVSDVFRGYRDLPHFVVAVRQSDPKTGDYYIVRATIDADVLNSYISSLDLKPSSDVFLIDRRGVLQTASRHHGTVLDPSPIPVPPFSSKTEVLETPDDKGEPRILGYSYIEKSPFIFVVLKRSEDVMASWLLFRSNILWLLGTSMVLIMAVTLWSSTILVSRIRDADRRHTKTLHAIAYNNKMASVGRMAAGVAHEINNPLAIINENAGLLKDLVSLNREPPEKDRLLNIAEKIARSVQRCSGITHRLLGFAKRMAPAIERFAVGPVLEEVLSFHGKETEYRRIAVNLDIPEDLPPIESDLGQLQQVFLNILTNAFAAVPDGGQVDVSAEVVDHDAVAIRIRDNGVGIPEEHLDHVFEPFFSTKGEYGTGLGLSITYGIVQNLGGRIDVQSKVGEGTTFTVRLPMTMRR